MRRRTRAAAALLTACVALSLPAAASANDFQRLYGDFKRTGSLKPCRYSDKQLANALKQTPPDVEQYAPSFLDALQAAREHSAACHKRSTPAPAPASTPTPSTPTPVPQATTPASAPTQTTPVATPPAPTPPASVSGIPSPPVKNLKRVAATPAPVSLLAVLAALAVVAALLAATAWWFAWSAGWARPLRASLAEFGDRLADGGREFGEWLRYGR